MRILTEKINLDLNQNGIQATIDLRKGDIESRLIIATLRGYGDAFRPDDNVIAVIRAKKPDGTIIYNNCLVEDGKVKFLVTSQYAAVEGNYNACIELIKDGVVLYSPKFSFHVSENELSDSEVESSSEYTELTTALEQALTALELAQNLHLLKFVENLEDEGDEKYLYVLTSDYHYIPYVWDAENERYMQLESNLEELTEFSYLLSIQKERVDNLLAEAVPGSTTRDLEVVDGRNGYDGRTYANLGTAIREQVNDLHSADSVILDSMRTADTNLNNIKANKSDVNTTTANIEAEIAVERARIDNIATLEDGSTTGDAELADIRVGADGVTDTSAGAAVRRQVSTLNNKIENIKDTLEYYKYNDDNLTISGYLSLTTGAVMTDASGFHCSYPIPIPKGATEITVTKSGNISGGAVVAFYTGYKHSATTFISGVNMPSSSNLPMKVTIPATAKYVAFCGRTTDEFEGIINSNKISNDVNTEINGFDFVLQAGSIGTDGTITYGSTSISNYISKMIYKNTFKSIKVKPKKGYLCNIAYYNNGVFVSRGSSWINCDSELNIDTTYDCIFMVALETTGTKTADEMLKGYDIQVITSNELQKVYENILKDNSKSKQLFEEKIASAIASKKIIHYSIDDAYRALRRLITESYTSIFDNYIFALIKDVHDTTGAVFTMNVINEIEDFDIANVPDTFASEFQANKDWLKFAWHGLWSTISYSSFEASYSKFVNNVYRFTGTYDCIDRITRTESFYGSLDAIQALKDNENASIIGFLTADDTRLSYYLDTNQNSIAINNGKYFDYDNEMIFIRSASRLDNVTDEQLIAEIESNPCYQNYVEVWYHEGLTSESIRTILKNIGAWASENGYSNYYPSKVFK